MIVNSFIYILKKLVYWTPMPQQLGTYYRSKQGLSRYSNTKSTSFTNTFTSCPIICKSLRQIDHFIREEISTIFRTYLNTVVWTRTTLYAFYYNRGGGRGMGEHKNLNNSYKRPQDTHSMGLSWQHERVV